MLLEGRELFKLWLYMISLAIELFYSSIKLLGSKLRKS